MKNLFSNIFRIQKLVLFLAAAIVFISCSKESKPPEPVATDYDYLIAGTWFEIYRTELTYNDSVVKRADTVSTIKGESRVNFERGIASYGDGKNPTNKSYTFDGTTLITYYQTTSDPNAEKYTVTFKQDTMFAVMVQQTSDGLYYYDKETKITYVR